ncbi:MAG: hypothetical protein EAX86_09320 [Candidatus Heimdallarchaeota archaeon]|nr:hypothetical protein [Candidatus Heimdallarchaeota archaeon]
MQKIRFRKRKISIESYFSLLLIFFMLLPIVPLIAFINMFAHEGGHGLVIVPAIIINQEIPGVPTEGMQENPFKKFPMGIFSLILAFPLGIIANGVLLYLAIKNILLIRNYESIKELIQFSILLSFSILNFSAILTNFFGSDFAFLVKDILQVPIEEQWFKYTLRIISYLVFPILLTILQDLELEKILIIIVATYLSNQITVELIVPLVTPLLMVNFWWLFIIGLPVLIIVMLFLIKNLELLQDRRSEDLGMT